MKEENITYHLIVLAIAIALLIGPGIIGSAALGISALAL